MVTDTAARVALIRSILASAEGRESEALAEVQVALNGGGIAEIIELRERREARGT